MTTDNLLDALRKALPERFVVDGELDVGGQGSVFKGSVDGVPAALKLFRPGDDRRIRRELDLLHQLDCPFLVKVIAACEIRFAGDELTVVAYELHSGGDLRKLILPSAEPLPEHVLAQIGFQVGNAVDALWAKRIVHRDIKPANVVRASESRFVLVDVGFARHIDRSALTGVGFVVGTEGYMSPEQAKGRRQLTIHSDAFSLGVTLYELAAKQHPFGRNQYRINSSTPPPPLNVLRNDLRVEFSHAVHRMMAFSSSARPRALADHFRPFVEG